MGFKNEKKNMYDNYIDFPKLKSYIICMQFTFVLPNQDQFNKLKRNNHTSLFLLTKYDTEHAVIHLDFQYKENFSPGPSSLICYSYLFVLYE